MNPLATRHHSPTASHSMVYAPYSIVRKSSGFTLIELLVVIAIIAILAGLGFSGMQGAMESSRKAQARNDVNQIASAVKAYVLEYGRLPETNNVILSLTPDGNPKKVAFFEAKNAKGTPPKGGLSPDKSKMFDPWGNAYVIKLDDNYDNKVEHDGATHLTTVVVETTGPDKKKINNVQ
jgi:prepilin-type N-terminal cleavage/methylation domain-containing protein